MKKFLAGLLAAALCIGVFGTASAQHGPVLITKAAKWATWGPNGVVGAPLDTAAFSGAMVDTTGPIYIGDMVFTNPSGGSAASAPGGILKVTLTSKGLFDNVDSLYYRIEHSVDGVSWNAPLAGNSLNNMVGAIAGFDQGVTATGSTVANSASFFVRIDPDQVQDGASGTAAIYNHAWWLSPFIRIFVRTLASDVALNTRIHVSYPGFRASP